MNGGRKAAKGPPSTDLLVCFPSRAQFSLTPKPICSPARLSDSANRHHNLHHRRQKSITRAGQLAAQTSTTPLWAKTKSMGSDISEPTSPKVTCAGQIKVRPKSGASSCKSWQSVMEEIERIHNSNKIKLNKRKPNWIESLGFKREIVQFLTCLRNIRFDFQCFGAFPAAEITSEDDEEEEDEINEVHANEASRTGLPKWVMVLQEGQSDGTNTAAAPAAPPPNALLLMRSNSTPAKRWLEERDEEEEEEEEGAVVEQKQRSGDELGKGMKKTKSLKSLMEEDSESLWVMKYESDFYKLSSDIAKETWVIGGGSRELPLSRTGSWKRW